jgi:hypothetical protein
VADRLIDFMEDLPGPTVIWLLVIFLGWVLGLNGILWLSGNSPVGVFDQDVSFAPVAGVYAIGLLVLLDRVATSALAQFQPALGDSQEGAQLGRRLTHIRDGQALIASVVLILVVTIGYASDPTAGPRLLARTPVSLAVAFGGYWMALALLATLIASTVRQLRLVSRLHAVAAQVDLFNPTAINALSRLTAATAVGIAVAGLPFTVQLPGVSGQGSVFGPITGAAFMTLAAVLFVLPLRGMHDRMLAEQRRLLAASSTRLKLTVARIHETVDKDDITRADGLQKTLSSLLAERDVIGRLPTWPWSSGTFRGLTTALLLPVLIFVITRLIDQLI